MEDLKKQLPSALFWKITFLISSTLKAFHPFSGLFFCARHFDIFCLLFLEHSLLGYLCLPPYHSLLSHSRHGISPRTLESLRGLFPAGSTLVFPDVSFKNGSLLPSSGGDSRVPLSIFSFTIGLAKIYNNILDKCQT